RTDISTLSLHDALPIFQRITVRDRTPPVIIGPADLKADCLGEIPPVDLGQVTVSDNCSLVTTRHAGDTVLTNGCTILVRWTYAGSEEHRYAVQSRPDIA